jgi:hypothetical protein
LVGRDGGWPTFGVFENQGDRVSFVASASAPTRSSDSLIVRPAIEATIR